MQNFLSHNIIAFLVALGIFVLFVFFILSVLYVMARYRYKRIMLTVCYLFVGLGFLLYTYEFLKNGVTPNVFINIPLAALRGVMTTARMFFVENDYDVLLRDTIGMHGWTWVRNVVLLLSHISALMILQTALLSFFGRKLVNGYRLCLGGHSDVYIINGCDKYALLLGEDIATIDDEKKKGYQNDDRLVVFLLGKDDDEKEIYKKVEHFDGMVQKLNKRNDILHCLKNAGLKEIELQEKAHCGFDKVLTSIRNFILKKLATILLVKEKKCHVILLPKNDISVSDDVCLIAEHTRNKETENIGAEKERLEIYAFVSSEWDRERIDAITRGGKDDKPYPHTIHIFSETDLLVRNMIKRHPPYECHGIIDTKSGKALRDFSVMILGFGSLGQSAFLRLMMNGQFVGSNMQAIIVDKKIDKLWASFKHRHPRLDLCCNVRIKSIDVRSEEFYKLLVDDVKSIDYVVVALGNDRLNKRIALNMWQHFEIKKCTVPYIAVFERDGGFHDFARNEKIFTFGCREKIYTESVIIREDVDRMAKAVHEFYLKKYGGKQWWELGWLLQESNRAVADFIPAMLYLIEKTEDDVRDIDDLTKIVDEKIIDGILSETEHGRWNAFHVAMGFKTIPIQEMKARFERCKISLKDKPMDDDERVKKCLDYCRRDSDARLQATLVPWDELDKVTATYNELQISAGIKEDALREFKRDDRDNIVNIPKFLRETKENNNQTTDGTKAFGLRAIVA